jgi:hypothetical protein
MCVLVGSTLTSWPARLRMPNYALAECCGVGLLVGLHEVTGARRVAYPAVPSTVGAPSEK